MWRYLCNKFNNSERWLMGGGALLLSLGLFLDFFPVNAFPDLHPKFSREGLSAERQKAYTQLLEARRAHSNKNYYRNPVASGQQNSFYTSAGPTAQASAGSLYMQDNHQVSQYYLDSNSKNKPSPLYSQTSEGLSKSQNKVGAQTWQSHASKSDLHEKFKLAPNSINPNTASLAQLDQLPGVGPALAQAIIDYRKTQGQFRQANDLAQVRGIGKKKLARILPYLFFP